MDWTTVTKRIKCEIIDLIDLLFRLAKAVQWTIVLCAHCYYLIGCCIVLSTFIVRHRQIYTHTRARVHTHCPSKFIRYFIYALRVPNRLTHFVWNSSLNGIDASAKKNEQVSQSRAQQLLTGAIVLPFTPNARFLSFDIKINGVFLCKRRHHNQDNKQPQKELDQRFTIQMSIIRQSTRSSH